MMHTKALHFQGSFEDRKVVFVVFKVMLMCEDFTKGIFLFCLQLKSERATENYLATLSSLA